MKYKIVAVINLLWGILLVSLSATFFLFVAPKLVDLYSQMGVKVSPTSYGLYLAWFLVIVLGFLNLFVGHQLLRGRVERYLKYGVLLVFSTIVLAVVFISAGAFAALSPIYNLTSQF